VPGIEPRTSPVQGRRSTSGNTPPHPIPLLLFVFQLGSHANFAWAGSDLDPPASSSQVTLGLQAGTTMPGPPSASLSLTRTIVMF
jgi:hypothetical protein